MAAVNVRFRSFIASPVFNNLLHRRHPASKNVAVSHQPRESTLRMVGGVCICCLTHQRNVLGATPARGPICLTAVGDNSEESSAIVSETIRCAPWRNSSGYFPGAGKTPRSAGVMTFRQTGDASHPSASC